MITIFGQKKPLIGPVRLDASITEEHELRYAISREPLETGLFYTDHILELPRPLQIVGAITATPDTLIPALTATRHIEGWRRLIDLARTRVPFTVVTSLARYSNMVIESLEYTRSAQTTNVLIVTAVLQQLQLALVDDIANLADAATDIAAAGASLGDQGLAEVL